MARGLARGLGAGGSALWALLLSCAPDPGTDVACNRNLDCPGGMICSDGLCRSPRDAGADASVRDAAAGERLDGDGGARDRARLEGDLALQGTPLPAAGTMRSARYRLRGRLLRWQVPPMQGGPYRLQLEPVPLHTSTGGTP